MAKANGWKDNSAMDFSQSSILWFISLADKIRCGCSGSGKKFFCISEKQSTFARLKNKMILRHNISEALTPALQGWGFYFYFYFGLEAIRG
jgi:hypothetical protein